ncbi:MAG TPA: hypothetical protein VGW74_05035 [Propionibacteriaceae bacterium]|nr:hypothetical protein [Propionibacteriaceae bacterium]
MSDEFRRDMDRKQLLGEVQALAAEDGVQLSADEWERLPPPRDWRRVWRLLGWAAVAVITVAVTVGGFYVTGLGPA